MMIERDVNKTPDCLIYQRAFIRAAGDICPSFCAQSTYNISPLQQFPPLFLKSRQVTFRLLRLRIIPQTLHRNSLNPRPRSWIRPSSFISHSLALSLGQPERIAIKGHNERLRQNISARGVRLIDSGVIKPGPRTDTLGSFYREGLRSVVVGERETWVDKRRLGKGKWVVVIHVAVGLRRVGVGRRACDDCC